MIVVDPDQRVAVLSGSGFSYAFRWDDEHTPLRHLHWGGPISLPDAVALAALPPLEHRRTGTESQPRGHEEEYPARGGLRRDELALRLSHADGDRSLDLEVVDVAEVDEGVVVRLRDRKEPVTVTLSYRVREGGALVRGASITNEGPEPVTVDQAASALWSVPIRPQVHLTSLTGCYSAEFQQQRERLARGRFVLESRSGIPGHEAFPYLAVDAEATEQAGEVWSVSLAWNGSFRMTALHQHDGRTTVTAEVNPFDLTHQLLPGETLTLPDSVGVYTPDGFADLTHRWHDYQRAHVTPEPERLRPVLYNSWEATYYDFTIADQVALAEVAADLGAELFVVDDGWFRPQRDDMVGLGDWVAAPEIFPEGVAVLGDAVRGLGMDFGLWIEPEMVNPEKSVLLAEHPDWVLGWPGRVPTLSRHQRVLDFGRPDVQEWAISTVSGLIEEAGLVYLKWDMNRAVSEPFAPGKQGRVWIDHARGVQRVMSELRQRHPGLVIEGCASGGGRADLLSQSINHWMWVSDQTDPYERIAIQRGYSSVLPAQTMESWVTDTPAGLASRVTPLAFRFDVAMSGALGLGGDIRAWSHEERELARAKVALYKEIRATVQQGRLWRLPSPVPGDTDAVAYVSPDGREAVVFVWFRTISATRARQWLRVPGLDPETTYRDDDGLELTGSLLATRGLPVVCAQLPDYSSRVIRLRAV